MRLRRHRQARRYTLRIHAASRDVVLTMPPRGSVKRGRRICAEARRLDRGAARAAAEAAPFAHGTVLPLRGVDASHRASARRARHGVGRDGDDGEHLLCVAGEAPHLPRRVRDFLKREAKRDLEAASRPAAQALGVSIKRVSVRDQSSRWGSCSTTGVLSYSWRLILAPPFVLDYLAAHEVAHLIEMNHSRRFWRLVEGICPHMRRAKAWLDAHGTDLHRYGATSSSARYSAEPIASCCAPALSRSRPCSRR